MTLEEIQALADAIETIEHYQRRFAVRTLVLVSKGLGWFLVGTAIALGHSFGKWIIQ